MKYTNEHEWIRVEGDIAYVGITDYAQEQLGDIVFVDIPTVGETLEAGETFGTIEVVQTLPQLQACGEQKARSFRTVHAYHSAVAQPSP